jgi:hypothetical protein
MSKGAYDVFTLVINFLSNDWQPKHVTIGLFETTKTIGQVLAKSLIELLDKCGLRKKIIIYVKDEGSNLNAMIGAWKSVANYECFGHKFLKACQYRIAKEKVSIKSTQANL